MTMARWQMEPFAIDVKIGDTKAFCACGLSKNGPYCDGSHKGSEFVPVKFEANANQYWATNALPV